MRTKELVSVVICLCLGVMRCPAQGEQGGVLKENSISEAIDISHDLERRLERWSKNDLLLILICPQVISPDGDPLAFPGEKKKLSVLGFGRLEKKDANILVSSIDKQRLRVPRLTGGFHADLYFLCASTQFSSLDRLPCYISNGFVDVKFDDFVKALATRLGLHLKGKTG